VLWIVPICVLKGVDWVFILPIEIWIKEIDGLQLLTGVQQRIRWYVVKYFVKSNKTVCSKLHPYNLSKYWHSYKTKDWSSGCEFSTKKNSFQERRKERRMEQTKITDQQKKNAKKTTIQEFAECSKVQEARKLEEEQRMRKVEQNHVRSRKKEMWRRQDVERRKKRLSKRKEIRNAKQKRLEENEQTTTCWRVHCMFSVSMHCILYKYYIWCKM